MKQPVTSVSLRKSLYRNRGVQYYFFRSLHLRISATPDHLPLLAFLKASICLAASSIFSLSRNLWSLLESTHILNASDAASPNFIPALAASAFEFLNVLPSTSLMLMLIEYLLIIPTIINLPTCSPSRGREDAYFRHCNILTFSGSVCPSRIIG